MINDDRGGATSAFRQVGRGFLRGGAGRRRACPRARSHPQTNRGEAENCRRQEGPDSKSTELRVRAPVEAPEPVPTGEDQRKLSRDLRRATALKLEGATRERLLHDCTAINIRRSINEQ